MSRSFAWQRLALTLMAVLAIAACTRPIRASQGTAAPGSEPLGTPAAPTAISPGGLPGDYVEEMISGGQTRRYRLHVPPSYQAEVPMPLVINLHGLNSNAAQQEKVSRMSAKADQAGFIVVYPEGLGDPQSWHFGPGAEGEADLRFLRELIQRLGAQYSLDSGRIYATGISNGAQMSNRLGCDMAQVIAAIAPVSGGYPAALACNPARPVPVVAFHGTADKILPYEGQGRLLQPVREWAAGWAARNGCDSQPAVTFQQGQVTGETWSGCREGADVTLYTIEGGGHSWPGSDMPAEITTQDIDATEVIWQFFADHPMP